MNVLVLARLRPHRLLLAALVLIGASVISGSAGATPGGVPPNAVGMLDCNGFSPIQHSLKPSMVCSDPRSIENGQGARFEDNEHYIGHDEPSTRFFVGRARVCEQRHLDREASARSGGAADGGQSRQ
jgi:hypothetical protein